MAIIITDHQRNEYFKRISNDIRKYTPQLFYFKKLSNILPPKPDSSSVLITVEERFFLITTAHSLYNRQINHLGIFVNTTFIGIAGNVAFHEPNEDEKYEPNNFDTAVVELDNSIVNDFKKKYDFLKWEKINFYQLDPQYSQYLVWGYPEKQTTIDFPTRKISSKELLLLSVEAKREYYLNEKINVPSTLVLVGETKIEIKDKIERPAQLPDFEGLSGCGVWYISNLLNTNPDYSLVSIITGKTNSQSYLYSTRVNVISAILKKNFKLNLP